MVISRVILRVTPFRALITLLITYLVSPLPLQVDYDTSKYRQVVLETGRVALFRDPHNTLRNPIPGLGFRV